MRIIFVGAVDFSRHCLKEVLKNDGNVVAVITLAGEHKSNHSDYALLSDIALRHRIPAYNVKNINSNDNVDLIRSLRPEVIFVFGWSQIISKRILDIPPLGCIGTHPALLPANRGRHPVVWALVKGLKESGLTFLYLDEGIDSGDILWQKPFEITFRDDAAKVYEKIKILAGKAIKEFLPELKDSTAKRVAQEHTCATYLRKRNERDGLINWTAKTIETYNLIRGLARPYVGAQGVGSNLGFS